MTLPNFLIIGAAKSGTSALYAYIKQHPDVFMSTPKELRYFSYNGPYPPNLPDAYIHPGVTSLEEYKNCFKDVENEKIIGEASPMYLYTRGTAEKIRDIIPNVKLLAILRNPVDRAYSAYMHAIRDWREPADSFRLALEKEQERIEAGWGMLWHYKNAGLYFRQLECYFNVFNPKQIKIVLYDDLLSDPNALLKDIFRFICVNETFSPDTSSRPNVSGFPKSQRFHEFMKRLFMEDNPIKRISRITLPKSFRKKVMVKLRERNLEKHSMPNDIRKDLIEFFRPDVNDLEKLINRDLSFWLK